MMLATFCCVEDLPVSALGAVLPWTWQSFDEFLKTIDIGLGVNMMPLVGHNPLRLSVMGGEAWDRAATPDEIADSIERQVLAFETDPSAGIVARSHMPDYLNKDGVECLASIAGDIRDLLLNPVRAKELSAAL